MDNSLQLQVDELNRKMDLVLELLAKQQERSEVVDDLVEDLNIVAKDAFQTAVDELTVQSIKIDSEDLRYLVFKLLRNVKTFGELMDMMESLMDLIHDFGPVVHDAGISITKALDDLDRQGYFSYFKQLGLLATEFKENVTEEDIARLRENMPALGIMLRSLTQPKVMNALAQITQTLSGMEMNETIDNKSLVGLARQVSKPDVRRTLSFTLRVLGELGKVKN